MVKIRLTRTGKKHEPHYRIVAVDSRRPRDGIYLDKIGYYNPRTNPPTLTYDKELLQKWIESGAQMTDTVLDIFVREGIVTQTGKRKARLELITKPEPKEMPEDPAEIHDEKDKKVNERAPGKKNPSQIQNSIKEEKDTSPQEDTAADEKVDSPKNNKVEKKDQEELEKVS